VLAHLLGQQCERRLRALVSGVSDVVNVAAINPHSCVNPAAAGDAKNPPVDTEGWISIRVSTANQIAAKSIHQSKWRQPHGHQAANSIGG
jgi:hypothetical protein